MSDVLGNLRSTLGPNIVLKQASTAGKIVTKIGYVVKRYPRFSETFIVNELLAHEQAGLNIEVFSLRPPVDTHFQDLISQVRAPVTYLSSGSVKANELWDVIRQMQTRFPQVVQNLGRVVQEDSLDVYCGLQLTLAALQRGITTICTHILRRAQPQLPVSPRSSAAFLTRLRHMPKTFFTIRLFIKIWLGRSQIRLSPLPFRTSICVIFNANFLQKRLPK